VTERPSDWHILSITASNPALEMEETKKSTLPSAESKAQHTEGVAAEEVEVPGPHDVLMGRGAPLSDHVGNQRLRQHVLEVRADYAAASTHVAKRKIALSVLAAVSARGGRFLRKRAKVTEPTSLPFGEDTEEQPAAEANSLLQGSASAVEQASSLKGAWGIVEDQAELLHKIKQLLRDMKPEARARRAQRKRRWRAKQTSPETASLPKHEAVAAVVNSANANSSVEQSTGHIRVGQAIRPLTQALANAPSTSGHPQGLAATFLSENLLRSLQQSAQQLGQVPGGIFSPTRSIHESRHPQSIHPLSLPLRNAPTQPASLTGTSTAPGATGGFPTILDASLRQALLSSLIERQQGGTTGGGSLPPQHHFPRLAQPPALWPFTTTSQHPGLLPGIPWEAATSRPTTNPPANDPLLDLLTVQQGWQNLSPVERLRFLEELQSSRPR
jgi:hypothetical protein